MRNIAGRRIYSAIGRLLLVLVIAGGAIACGKAAGPVEPAIIHHIGDAIPLGGLLFTVNSVSFPEPTEFTVPDPGKKFLGIDVTIKNAGEQRVNVFSRNLMIVKDSQGRQYNEDPTATSAAGKAPPDGDPFPGQQVLAAWPAIRSRRTRPDSS